MHASGIITHNLYIGMPLLTSIHVVDRLSSKTLEAHAEQYKQRSKPCSSYGSIPEFTATLDQWCAKWSHLHNDRNETPEATVLRLAATLSRDENILQVTDTKPSLAS